MGGGGYAGGGGGADFFDQFWGFRGFGGNPFDFVLVKVEADNELDRDGLDILSQVSVPYYDAILGSSVQIRTVDGTVELKVPSGTRPDTILLLANKGVPKVSRPGVRGNHLVKVKVTIPKILTKEEREMVLKLKSI